jgi:hypothetical protein
MGALAMKIVTVLSVLVGSLIVAGQLRAETMVTRLTPEKTGDHFYSFTIKVERLKKPEAGEFFEFHVTVKAKNAGDHLKEPRLSGKLEVFNGKELVSSCRVQPTERDGELSFSFRVAAKYAEMSQFAYAEEGDMDSIHYWFYLKDFVESK